MDDDAEARAPRDLEPAPGECRPLLERERGAFARGAADEGEADAVGPEVGGLRLHDVEAERAVRVERGVDGSDETGEGTLGLHGASRSSSGRGRTRRMRTTETIAAPEKMPKMTASGTRASRSAPKPQSANPPQLMLTKFIRP